MSDRAIVLQTFLELVLLARRCAVHADGEQQPLPLTARLVGALAAQQHPNRL